MRKKVNDQEHDLDKVAVFKNFCKDNILVFSVIETFFSSEKFKQILDIRTT